MNQPIEHSGIINEINPERIHVLINQQTACSDCQAKEICFSTGKDQKIIEVDNTSPILKVGDNVIVFGKKSIGLQAVLLAFVLPFILIFITLIILNLFFANELISGGMSILILIPYYGIISMFNKKIKLNFRFDIRKNQDV